MSTPSLGGLPARGERRMLASASGGGRQPVVDRTYPRGTPRRGEVTGVPALASPLPRVRGGELELPQAAALRCQELRARPRGHFVRRGRIGVQEPVSYTHLRAH